MNNRYAVSAREGLREGYLTLFLTLILTVMMSFCMMLIREVRENTRQFAAEYVTDIGVNSILAEYHRELFNQYNLLFMDISYGTDTVSYDSMISHLKEYIQENLSTESLFLGSYYRDPIQLSLSEANLKGALGACDAGGREIRRQAVDAMQQDIGITYLDKVMEWAEEADRYGLFSRDLLQEQKSAVEELENLTGMDSSMIFDEEEEEESVVSFWEAGILNMVADRETISSQMVTLSNYASHRERVEGTGALENTLFEDGFMDKLFFQEYILSYTGQYGNPKEDSLLKYQTEYILFGQNSDVNNLKMAVSQLLGIRGVANLVSIMQDTEKKSCAEMLAYSIAVALTVPEIAEVLAFVFELIWAMAEAIYDVSMLLNNERIPLIKKSTDWHYSLENAMNFELPDKADKSKLSDGLSYPDYLRIMMCLHDKEILSLRLADIMEMDIRKTEGNQSFRMDGCFDRVHLNLLFGSSDEGKYSTDGIYGY